MKFHHFKQWFLCTEIEYHNLINYYNSDIVFDIKKYVKWLENDIYPENRRKIRQTDIFHYFHIIPLDILREYFINYSKLFYEEYPFAKDGDAQKQQIVTYFLFKLESLVEEIQDSYFIHNSNNFYIYYRDFDISVKEFNYYIVGDNKDNTYILQYLERVKEIVSDKSLFLIQNENNKINIQSNLLTNENIKSYTWNYHKDKNDIIKQLYDELKSYEKIDCTFKEFKGIFSGDFKYKRIKWKARLNELIYLIYLLWEKDLVIEPTYSKKTFFNCFDIENVNESNYSPLLSNMRKGNKIPASSKFYLSVVNKLKEKQFG